MLIGIISDIHANFEALKEVIEYLNNKKVDIILCAGDIIGYYNKPNEVINLLKDNKVKCIKGNHEVALIKNLGENFNNSAQRALNYTKNIINSENLLFIEKLPLIFESYLDNKKIIMVHGSINDPLRDYVYPEDVQDLLSEISNLDVDVVIMGQTHVPFIKRLYNKIIINPGSVGQPRDNNPKSSFVIYSTKDNKAEIIRLDYNIKNAINNSLKDFPKENFDRLFLGR